jgi:adenine-specific DNA-methyltransferase
LKMLSSLMSTVSEPDRLAIEALVQKCRDAKGVDVIEWEAEIDDRVAHLYGLTDEEMKIIRGE